MINRESNVYQIRDWLYVSGFVTATDSQWLEHVGIKAMLLLFKPLRYAGMENLFIATEEGTAISDEDIRLGLDFVKEQHEKGSKVLISCGAGISRSATFAVAALKVIEDLSLRDAYAVVKAEHPDAMPDEKHWESLRRYFDEGDAFWDVWQDVVMPDIE